ncbi:MAG: Uma2 family endonuclease [Phycisphaerae bacterium]|nr:Uma2 family endonuclease [Phycisphaerae bacterium]
MVASTLISDPFPLPVEWIAARRASEVLLTVDDVDAMMQAGIVPEDATTELLHGALLYTDRATAIHGAGARLHAERFDPKGGGIVEGPDHNYVVSGFAELAPRINSPHRHLRTQSTIICSEIHAPIPDAVILHGPRTDYRGRRPTAADAIVVIEVADSSYERDSGEKLFGYARAGIPQYIIINLRNRTAEEYTRPNPSAGTYAAPRIIPPDGTLEIRLGNDESFPIALAELWP